MTGRVAGAARAIGYALVVGAVSWVFSEGAYWARFQPDETVGEVLLTWVAYSVVGYLALAVARRYAVAGMAGWFVIGALFGWLAEGVVAGTVIIWAPHQIAWTGLAWHAPLTVVAGWVALPRLLAGAPHAAVGVLAAGGAGVGLWGAGSAHGPDGGVPLTTLQFAAYSALLVAVLALAYPIAGHLAPRSASRPGRAGVILAATLAAAWYLAGIAPGSPESVPLVVALLALPILVLRRAPAQGAGSAAPPWGPLPARAVLPLGIVPLTAAATYALSEPVVGDLPVTITFALTTPLSVIALVLCIRHVRRHGA